MSKAEEKAKEFLKKLVSHTTLYKDTIDELEVYEPDDVIWAYKEGYHQAEKDLTDKAKVSSSWDGFYYGQGYKQVEKDLELTWEDVSKIISIDQQICGTMGISDYTHNHQQAMEEVLKQFKDFKERKEK